MFGSWVLNEIWTIHLHEEPITWVVDSWSTCLFNLGWYVNVVSNFFFFRRSSYTQVWGLLLELHCVIYSRQACLYYLRKNEQFSIHIYQFTFELLHFCFRMWWWFRSWTKLFPDRPIWRKAGIGRFEYPYSPSTPPPPPSPIKTREWFDINNTILIPNVTTILAGSDRVSWCRCR